MNREELKVRKSRKMEGEKRNEKKIEPGGIERVREKE
jgi:hypothetical protein